MSRQWSDEEDGFTLIELMVVVLIIAILIAIAIPTFLGARKRAQDRAAQSSLRNALTAAKTIFTDNESYASATSTTLAEAETSLCFIPANVSATTDGAAAAGSCTGAPTNSDDPNEIVIVRLGGTASPPTTNCVNTSGSQTSPCSLFRASAFSKSGVCFYVQDQAGPTSTTSGLGTTYARSATGQANCGTPPTTGYSATGWSGN